jgi:enterochelin esterase-like enzyme
MKETRNSLKAVFVDFVLCGRRTWRLDIRLAFTALILLATLTACDPMIPVIEPTVPTPTLSGTETPTPRPTETVTPPASPTPDRSPTPTPFPCDEDGVVVEIDDNESAIARENLPYQAYLPPCYQSSLKRYPLVLLFADAPRNSGLMETLGIAQTMDQGIRLGALPPMVVVVADLGQQGTRNQFPPERSAEAVIRDELLPGLARDFCLIGQRAFRTVGGFGRGGFWAVLTTFRTPDLFSAVGGHSAVLNNTVPPADNPLEIARNSTILPGAGLRLYFDNGTADEAAAAGLQLLSDRLTARQIPHTYIINPVGEGDADYWSAHISEYLDFYSRGWPKDYAALPTCTEPSP